ncbi:SusC/RagA family TonB-linked outer membrane protein [Longitalea luteola]|uniref:SusC/RagA family TonB-linked outer membrane protein n=1 Tax=Longitalea luteola TaxID=2812563 RepID=UPI001A9676B5|nr:TonB-dependent receptor [Longitalea luteola]
MTQRYNVVKGCAMPFTKGRLIVSWLLPVLLHVLLVLPVLAQNANPAIKGVVENEKGEPLEGVTIDMKNEAGDLKRSAVTTKKGAFTFDNPGVKGTYIFTISHIGYVTQVVRKENFDPQKEETISIVLKANAADLEVVVVSYGKQRKQEVTGSIVQQNAAELQDMPVGQFAQQLQGKVAGVQVGQNSGTPGRGMEFRIRGAASFASDNQPLFVVDGIPITGSINNINPSEIESFTILKDAAASSLYGSRAANGVVLITTKHAKAGDAKVEFNTFYGSQVIPKKGRPDMMTAREFAEFQNEYYEDRVKYEGFTGTLNPVYQNPERYGDGTNWFDVLTRNAPIQNYDLTVSSATGRSSSTVMAGYQDQQGVILNTGTKLFSLRYNQDFTLVNNKLKIGFGIAPSYRLDHNNRLGTEGVNNLIEKIVEASPLIAPVDSNGNMPLYVHSPGMVANVNPYAQFTQIKDDYKTTRILGNAYVNYELLKGLSIKGYLAVDKGAETRSRYSPASISTTNIATGTSSSVDNYSWTTEATLNYSKTLFNDHHIELLAGYSAQQFEQESNAINGTNFPSDDVQFLSAATSITSGASNATAYSLVSTIGRLNYNFRGKYLLSGAIRRDGSSRFGVNTKYGNFPSISAGWVISNENFMERFRTFSFLKLRASYGITGNNNIGNYTSIPQVAYSNYVFNGALVSGATIATLQNPGLQWERNKQFDIGVDLTLFNNRLSFTYDYYHKLSDGLIQDRPIPRASGYTSVSSNVGILEFWGHEFTLSGAILTGKVTWNASVNMTFDRNKIKKLLAPGFIRRNNTITSDYYRNQEGHALGEFYGFVFDGLYKDAEDLANSPKYGSASDVGTIKMKDVTPDKVINESDRTFIGNPNPDFLFGTSHQLSYKNFDLSITVAGSYGGKILNPSKWAYLTNLDGARGLLAAVKDRWRSPENPGSGVYPRTKTGTTAIGRSVNSQWVEDGSYLAVKNIALGYSIPLKGNTAFKSLRVFGSIQNALILTKYSGINPEISLNGLNGYGIGIDENAYPVPRVFAIGLSTSFK